MIYIPNGCYRDIGKHLSETMANRYSLRASNRNYRELTAIKLPKARKTSRKDKLYPIEVVEIDGCRGRIHYDDSFDEWRDLSELINIPQHPSHDSASVIHDKPFQPYNLYNELRVKIKQSLICRAGKGSPSITIDMGFDYLLF